MKVKDIELAQNVLEKAENCKLNGNYTHDVMCLVPDLLYLAERVIDLINVLQIKSEMEAGQWLL